MQVEAVRAWPGRFESVRLELAEGATVADALRLLPFDLTGCAGLAIHGERAIDASVLHDGDRLELLRALVIDPKTARRVRATRARN